MDQQLTTQHKITNMQKQTIKTQVKKKLKFQNQH
jgi:hypothetical protein